jgi:hypothetical protein
MTKAGNKVHAFPRWFETGDWTVARTGRLESLPYAFGSQFGENFGGLAAMSFQRTFGPDDEI